MDDESLSPQDAAKKRSTVRVDRGSPAIGARHTGVEGRVSPGLRAFLKMDATDEPPQDELVMPPETAKLWRELKLYAVGDQVLDHILKLSTEGIAARQFMEWLEGQADTDTARRITARREADTAGFDALVWLVTTFGDPAKESIPVGPAEDKALVPSGVTQFIEDIRALKSPPQTSPPPRSAQGPDRFIGPTNPDHPDVNTEPGGRSQA